MAKSLLTAHGFIRPQDGSWNIRLFRNRCVLCRLLHQLCVVITTLKQQLEQGCMSLSCRALVLKLKNILATAATVLQVP
jgi:hypothetical protein